MVLEVDPLVIFIQKSPLLLKLFRCFFTTQFMTSLVTVLVLPIIITVNFNKTIKTDLH